MTTAEPDPDPTPCYLARAVCGCPRGVAVIDADFPAETAQALAEWVRDGLQIERTTVAAVRVLSFRCPHGLRAGGGLQGAML